MTAQLVWLARNTIEAGSGNPIVEASSIAICAIYFTNQVRYHRATRISVSALLMFPRARSCCARLRRLLAASWRSSRERKGTIETSKAA
jgi:hypothetical protein